MMVQIVEHRAETSVDFVVEEEAASSTPQVPNHLVPDTAAVHAGWQHTAAQTSRTPSRATPGALSAARELLRHPPSSIASPGAMKQWRDDIDQLLGMAHSTSTRSRPRSSQRQHEALASVRSPSVRGAQTNDLRAVLDHRRAGEDARVSLERACERRQNIEARNLDQDFAAVAPPTPMGTRSQAGVPLGGMGCAAIADHLHAASWLPKFRPHLPEKYDGTSNPSEFLLVYVTAITAAGGNTAVMVTYFHVALSGPARTWLMNLAPGSIYSWEELCAWFVANFASAYQQHDVEAHLHAVRQEPGETLRTFISRFTKVRGTVAQDDKKKKKKNRGNEKSHSAALVVAATTGGRGDHSKCPWPPRGNGGTCPVHPNGRCPSRRLRYRRSGRQEKEEKEPRQREAALHRSGRGSCDWGPGRPQQMPMATEG
jgi:hypothetical protein